MKDFKESKELKEHKEHFIVSLRSLISLRSLFSSLRHHLQTLLECLHRDILILQIIHEFLELRGCC